MKALFFFVLIERNGKGVSYIKSDVPLSNSKATQLFFEVI